MRYCSSQNYSEIISGIKSIISKKQATEEYKINIDLNDTDISMLQKGRKEPKKVFLHHEFKKSLKPEDTTIDRIRKLFQSPNSEYSKKEIMCNCERGKSSVEKALYQLINSGELRYVSKKNIKERYYKRNISFKEELMAFYHRKK